MFVPTFLEISLLLSSVANVWGFEHIQGRHSAIEIPIDTGEDPFARNHLIQVSWTHPDIQASLWNGNPLPSPAASKGRKRLLSKRSPGTGLGPTCLGCLESGNGKQWTIGELNTNFLVTQMLKNEGDIRGKCIFYTGVSEDDKVKQLWGRGENLSRVAAEFACRLGMYSIWTLFPGRDENKVPNEHPPDDVTRRNYWEVFTPNSWLNHLANTPSQFTYFENMSRAMARQCGGKVFVMSLRPDDLPYYGSGGQDNLHSIWNTVEYPELKAQGKITELIAIDINDPKKMKKLKLSDQSVEGDYTGTVPREVQEIQDMLAKRATCTENLQYQPPGDDWFGSGRR